jgi:DNA-binding response OmpR family regulator
MSDYTILLIDYDPRSIERLRAPLVQAGMHVEVAKDGLTGIKRFHELRPDLTLIEAMIPKKHGFEVCQELKRTPHGQTSAVLIITSVYKGRKYRSQAMHNYRCDEYLEKPITDEALVSIIQRHLPQRQPQGVVQPAESAPRSPSEGLREVSRDIDTNPLRDIADDELIDRLDTLLPGDKGRSSEPEPEPAETDAAPGRGARNPRNVVSFDIVRARTRPPVPSGEGAGPTVELPAGPVTRGSFSGGLQPAMLPEPLQVRRIDPASEQRRHDPSMSRPGSDSGSRERLYFWIALVLAAALVTVLAAALVL